MLPLPSRSALHPGAVSTLSLLILTEAVSTPPLHTKFWGHSSEETEPSKKKKYTVPKADSSWLSQVSEQKGLPLGK